MFRIALRTLRFRTGAFVATFIAMMFGAVLVLACAGLVETGIRGEVPAQRLATTQLVVTGDQSYELPKEDPTDPEADTENGYLPERVRLDSALVDEIARVPGVSAAVGDVSFPATVVREAGLASATGHGWSSAALTPYRLTAGGEPAAGEVVLDRALAQGASVGDRLELVIHGRTETFRVSGIAEGKSREAGVFFADVDVDQLSGHPGRVDLIGVRTEADADLGAVRQRLDAVLAAEHATVLSGNERGITEFAESGRSGENLIVLGAVFGGLATMVMLFVVSTTLGLSIQQRQRELALLRAIGTTPGQLRRMVIGETLVMSLFATTLGCVVGVFFGEWLFDRLAANGVVPVAMTYHVGMVPMIITAGSGLIGAVVAAFVAGRRAARTRPTEALADAAIQRRWLSPTRLILAVLAFAGGTALFIVTVTVMTGPIAASTAGPSVMLWATAMALVAPGITKVLLVALRAPVRAVTGTAGYLAVLSTKTRAVRMAAVVTPIMLATGAATANIYLQTTQVAVSQEAFVENLRADLVLSSSTGGLSPSLVDEVRAVPGVAAASEFATTSVFVERPYDSSLSEDGWPVQGVTASAAAQTTAVAASDGTLTELTGNTVALPESHAADLGRGVGDTIAVRMGDGVPVDVRIVAVYPSREGFETLLMPVELVAAHTTSGLPAQIMVRTEPGADVAPALTALVADRPGVVVVDRDALVAGHASDQEVGLWINYLMAGMIVLYTAISVVNSLVMSTTARRREFGLQRLTGSTRGQVLRMIAVESGLAVIIGVLLGTLVAGATLMPFTLVTDGSILPSGPVAVYLGVIGAAAVLTFGSALASTWVGTRTRPAEAAVAPA